MASEKNPAWREGVLQQEPINVVILGFHHKHLLLGLYDDENDTFITCGTLFRCLSAQELEKIKKHLIDYPHGSERVGNVTYLSCHTQYKDWVYVQPRLVGQVCCSKIGLLARWEPVVSAYINNAGVSLSDAIFSIKSLRKDLELVTPMSKIIRRIEDRTEPNPLEIKNFWEVSE